jgi:hypothetical protein
MVWALKHAYLVAATRLNRSTCAKGKVNCDVSSSPSQPSGKVAAILYLQLIMRMKNVLNWSFDWSVEKQGKAFRSDIGTLHPFAGDPPPPPPVGPVLCSEGGDDCSGYAAFFDRCNDFM